MAGGFTGIGCVGEVNSPGTVLCSDRRFLDAEYRLARLAIQNVHVPDLAGLRQRRNLLARSP